MNTDRLFQQLAESMGDDADFSQQAKALYATDASNYRQIPIGLVRPRSALDVERTIAACRAHGAPLLSRGGGTSLAGQGCNEAVVMDFSRHMHHIVEINPEERYARVQPGIVLDDLRHAAGQYGLTFGPDPATHSRCTIGGMLGNNSCGVHAVMAGRTSDNVISLEVLTYDGVRMTVGETSPEELEEIIRAGGRKGEIYRRLRDLRDHYAKLVREKYPNIPRRVSGFNLDELLPERNFHVARALVGSESTCVTILEAKLKLLPNPPVRQLLVIGFEDVYAAAAAVPALMDAGPIGLEGVDDVLAQDMRMKHLHAKNLSLLPEGNSWLFYEVGADTEEEARAKAARAKAVAEKQRDYRDLKILEKEEEQQKLWAVREAGLGATAMIPAQPDAWEGWEDSAVPPERLEGYLRDFRKLLNKYGYRGALYGHFGQACVHTRITFDLVTEPGIEKYHRFTEEAADLVVRYGGSLSGEHGDGQSRAELLPRMFGTEIVEAFAEFKKIWDPEGKMNPGKVVHPFSNTENLRLGTNYQPWHPDTVFQFPEDNHDFARAALRCVGVGACRKKDDGIMCPSYMATGEEKHSTRGRARLLWEMLKGETVTDGWKSQSVKEALDLCLACKGCKNECPVNVDMATYKAEFLHHFYKGKLRPRHAYAFGFIAWWARLASYVPRLANLFTQTKLFAPLAKWVAGVAQPRRIPAFAEETFRSWFARTEKERAAADGRSTVVLWPDTFTNHFHTDVAKAAVEVLEAAGFHVKVPAKNFCCGRPLYDFGFLPTAKRWLENIVTGMREEIRAGLPVVFLEPSCAAVFRDELGNLLPADEDALRLKKQSYLLSEFLEDRVPHFPWPKLKGEALVQGHCHHRSVLKFPAEQSLLAKIYEKVDVMNSTCCGMAGAFGFEAEHYDVSQSVGNLKVLPTVRGADPGTEVLADGFSCREQISQGTDRAPRHIAEILAEALRAGAAKPADVKIPAAS